MQVLTGLPSDEGFIVSEVQKCRECGGEDLLWSQHNSNKTGIAEGRLRTHEVTCSFVLGCEDCSETIAVISADKFISNYDAAQAELAKLREDLASANSDKAAYGQNAIDLQQRLTAAEQRNADLLKAVEQSIEWFETMSSGDGSGHADLARAIRRIAKLNTTESGANE